METTLSRIATDIERQNDLLETLVKLLAVSIANEGRSSSARTGAQELINEVSRSQLHGFTIGG